MSDQSGPLSLGAARISPPLRIPAPQLLLQTSISAPEPSLPVRSPVQASWLGLLQPLGLQRGFWDRQLGPGQTSFPASQGSHLVLLTAGAILTFEAGRGGGMLI